MINRDFIIEKVRCIIVNTERMVIVFHGLQPTMHDIMVCINNNKVKS